MSLKSVKSYETSRLKLAKIFLIQKRIYEFILTLEWMLYAPLVVIRTYIIFLRLQTWYFLQSLPCGKHLGVVGLAPSPHFFPNHTFVIFFYLTFTFESFCVQKCFFPAIPNGQTTNHSVLLFGKRARRACVVVVCYTCLVLQ